MNPSRFLLLLLAVGLTAFGSAQDQTSPPPSAPGGTSQPASPDAPTQTNQQRVITIDDSGGTQSGNLRFGPIVYEHPDPFGIKATVSTLTIYGHHAVLKAPDGVSIFKGGERTATFDGGVKVERGRLTATGPSLVYSEERNLGQLTEQGGQVTITRTDADGKKLVITADEIRVLTDQKKLYATGNVTVVDGSITSKGATVFFDDNQAIAEILGAAGKPATAVDSKNGSSLRADRIKQDVKYDYFEAMDASAPSLFDTSAFAMTPPSGSSSP
ncbi:MAG: hypothetical protein P8Y02_11510 [Deinococcales bacterium]